MLVNKLSKSLNKLGYPIISSSFSMKQRVRDHVGESCRTRISLTFNVIDNAIMGKKPYTVMANEYVHETEKDTVIQDDTKMDEEADEEFD